jgi:hypothetical protein
LRFHVYKGTIERREKEKMELKGDKEKRRKRGM